MFSELTGTRIKRPTDRANPAAVDYYVQHGRSTGPELN